MKKIAKRLIYILSVVFVITGMLLIFPSQIFACHTTIIVHKISSAGGITGTFNFTKSGGGSIQVGVGSSNSFSIDTASSGGTYTITETDSGNYQTRVSEGSSGGPGSWSDGKSISITLQKEEQTTKHIWFDNYVPTPTTGGLVITKAVVGGLTGTFNFEVRNPAGTLIASPSITINTGETSKSIDPITGLAPGTYTVTETTTGAFSTVSVPSDGAVAVVAGQNAAITFTNTSTAPTTGTVTITKNISASQGSDTVFTISVNPAINGQSSYSVTVSAGSTTGTVTISNVPFDVAYSMSEDSLSGWTLTGSSNTSFTLSADSPTANPTFNNSTSEEPTTTTTPPTTTTTLPTSGSIQIVKIITASQGSDTTFGFTINPAINGQSSYSITIPAGQTEGRLTIGNVPFGITYSVSENTPPAGWTLFQSEGTSFTLSISAAFATPAFWNAPPGGPTTTAPGGIVVAGITTGPGGIEVAGIQEMPFTGLKDNLLIFGVGFIVLGIIMMILIPAFLRTGKHQVIR